MNIDIRKGEKKSNDKGKGRKIVEKEEEKRCKTRGKEERTKERG